MQIVNRIFAATIPVIAFVAFSAAQNAPSKDDFVINQNRAYVYLLFDHMGKGPRFTDDEPATRIWFKLVNNCRVPILVRTFGTPFGSLNGEVGVFHDVVRDKTGIVTPDLQRTRSTESEQRMPSGYGVDLSSVADIAPNGSLLFSVPISHLNGAWHIEIPYEFKLPSGKCCRSENVGGEPKMVLLYSIADLPGDVRRELRPQR